MITSEAEKFILNICNNSMRLVINYMEKFKLLDTKITLEKAKQICTNISFYEFENYTKAYAAKLSLMKDFPNWWIISSELTVKTSDLGPF